MEQAVSSIREMRRVTGVRTLALVKSLAMGTITGGLIGLVSTFFYFCLATVTAFRQENPWVLFLLPAAGLLIVFLYQVFRDTRDTGTNMVIASLRSSSEITYQMAPLIFVTTVLTHLCGGSAGREGAALQIGGGIANFLSRIPFFRFTEEDRKTNVMCGMSAGFSALFGTPLAAAIFTLEVVNVGILQYSALVPCVLSAFTAHFVASYFGVGAEAFFVPSIPEIGQIAMMKFLTFGILVALVSAVFCMVLHGCEHVYKRLFPNPYLRIAAAGILLPVLTMALGTDRFLGSGISIIEEIFEQATPAGSIDFLVKMIFTGLTLGAGFKGGEIVPSFCIGAAFGSCAAGILGVPVPLAAACGMVGVFCGVTNCPMTSLFIAFEMFGFEGMPYYLITIAVSYMFSGYYGLYHSQRIVYSKTKNKLIDRNAY